MPRTWTTSRRTCQRKLGGGARGREPLGGAVHQRRPQRRWRTHRSGESAVGGRCRRSPGRVQEVNKDTGTIRGWLARPWSPGPPRRCPIVSPRRQARGWGDQDSQQDYPPQQDYQQQQPPSDTRRSSRRPRHLHRRPVLAPTVWVTSSNGWPASTRRASSPTKSSRRPNPSCSASDPPPRGRTSAGPIVAGAVKRLRRGDVQRSGGGELTRTSAIVRPSSVTTNGRGSLP